jgi:hypothetical protein
MDVFKSAEGIVISRGGFRKDFNVTGKVVVVVAFEEEVRGVKGGPVDLGRIIWASIRRLD